MKYKQDRQVDNVIYGLCIALYSTITLIYLSYRLFNFSLADHIPPCLLHQLTGLYCPGCGGTRAFFYLLKGEIIRSLYYHLFVFFGVLYTLSYMIIQTLVRLFPNKEWRGFSFRPLHIYIGVIIILVQCIIKNVVLVVYHFPMIR